MTREPTPMERRRRARQVPAAHTALARVRVRGGSELTVLDCSDVGARLEGSHRLLPGTRIDIHVITRSGRVLVRARIVRAYVSALQPGAVTYRAGVAFDQPVDTAPG